MNRRDVLFGALGFAVGGALAAGTGLGYMFYRRATLAKAKGRRTVVSDSLDDWVLTDADRTALAHSADQAGPLMMLNNVDLPGAGDIRSAQVTDVAECAALCEADANCNAFTFARPSHPKVEKRNKCWIKSDQTPPKKVVDIHYISGLRP